MVLAASVSQIKFRFWQRSPQILHFMDLSHQNQEIAQLYRHSLCESEKLLDSLHEHENVK